MGFQNNANNKACTNKINTDVRDGGVGGVEATSDNFVIARASRSVILKGACGAQLWKTQPEPESGGQSKLNDGRKTKNPATYRVMSRQVTRRM